MSENCLYPKVFCSPCCHHHPQVALASARILLHAVASCVCINEVAESYCFNFPANTATSLKAVMLILMVISFHLLHIFNCSAKFIRLEHQKMYFQTAGNHLSTSFVFKELAKKGSFFAIGQAKVTLFRQSIQLVLVDLFLFQFSKQFSIWDMLTITVIIQTACTKLKISSFPHYLAVILKGT